MSEDLKKQEALHVYEALCATLEHAELKFGRNEEEMTAFLTLGGDDLPMEFLFYVHADAQLVRLVHMLPFKVEGEKLVDAALAVAFANSKILNGSFDLDLETGNLLFNIFAPFHGSILGEEVFRYLLGAAAGTVDLYNDLFLALFKGMIDFERFVALVKEKA